MKVFSILKSASVLNPHVQEDYFVVSKKQPIFVVADGVSLDVTLGEKYPANSGAGEAAKIFCEAVINEAEKRYEEFDEKDLLEIFEIGNRLILEYNILHNRTQKSINYFDVDLFSATTSFLLIKNNRGAEGKDMLAKEMQLYPESKPFIEQILKTIQ